MVNPVPADWLTAIVDSSEDVIVVLDTLRTIRFANKAALAFALQTGAGPVVGANYEDILKHSIMLNEDGSHVPRELDPSTVAFSTGKAVPRTVFQYIIQDIPYFVEVSSFPLFDAQGAVEYVVVRFTGVSEKKARESELKSLVESKDSFLATLSHELRNPLAPIKSMLELMKLQTNDTELRRGISVIEHQFDHLTKILTDLLEVNRYARGKISVELRRVNLLTVIRNSTDSAISFLKKKDIELSVAVPENPIVIRGDQTRLEQAFMNVLHNAEKFTPVKGHVWVSITSDDKKVSISIRDDGIGIEADMLEYLFEPALRDKSAKHKTEGLGLGLVLVKDIVELHGGTIIAKSDGLRKGSEFTITLPVLQQRLL